MWQEQARFRIRRQQHARTGRRYREGEHCFTIWYFLKCRLILHLTTALQIRKHLQIEKWHVFGGSWGACLQLAYAQAHPEPVLSMTLRGIFTLRREELEFFYQGMDSNGDGLVDVPLPLSSQADQLHFHDNRPWYKFPIPRL